MQPLPPEIVAHRLATRLKKRVVSARWPPWNSRARVQACKAATSIVANIGEGSFKVGLDRRKSFRVAVSEIGELSALLDANGVRAGRKVVLELRRILLPLAELEDWNPEALVSCVLPQAQPGVVPDPGLARGVALVRGHSSHEKFPEGYPWEYRFENTPFGLPYTHDHFEFLLRWMEDWRERVRNGTFRPHRRREPTWRQEN